jgi:hypothetical protein
MGVDLEAWVFNKDMGIELKASGVMIIHSRKSVRCSHGHCSDRERVSPSEELNYFFQSHEGVCIPF